MNRILFHTQEHRGTVLAQPIVCTRADAWLGSGYYFWYSIEDAHHWGNSSKKQTGQYEIYQSDIDCSNVLDTVFNEAHYLFWVDQIQKVTQTFHDSGITDITLKEINEYFKEKGQWDDVDGILFQDLPTNTSSILIKKNPGNRKRFFIFRKRIQLVVYHLNVLNNFVLLGVHPCTSK